MFVSHLQRIAPSPSDGLTAQDRELLTHWHKVASKAITDQSGTDDLWQYEVTHLAFDHPVILNLALALSSFERAHTAHLSQTDLLAHRRRRDIYISLGFNYSRNAVGLMRDAVANANRNNGPLCHLASILMMINSYAEGSAKELVRPDNDRQSMLNDLMVTCRLTRGVRAIADTFGVIRPDRREKMLFVTDIEPPDRGPLDPLLGLLDSLIFLDQEDDPGKRQICQDALDLMKWLVRKAQTSKMWPAHRASLQWACLVNKDFMELLDAHEPAALVLLSYGCFLADDVSNSFIMMGWKEGVCAEIRDVVGPRWSWAVAG